MWFGKKKYTFISVAATLLFAGISLFSAPLALAVQTGDGGSGGSAGLTWVDVSTITDGSLVYKNNNIDTRDANNENYDVYVLQNDPDGCPDTIKLGPTNFYVDAFKSGDTTQVPNDPEKVTLTKKAKSVTETCGSKSSTAFVTGGKNFAISLKPNADGSVSVLGSSRGYKFLYDTQLKTYVRSVEDNCKDTLEIAPGSTTAKLTVRTQQHSFSPANSDKEIYLKSDYVHYSFVNQLDYSKEGPGGKCWESQVATVSMSGPLTNADPNSGATTTTPSDNPGGKDDPCVQASGAYGWALCPAFEKAKEFLDGAYSKIIKPLLEVTPLTTTTKDPNDSSKTVPNPIFQVWKAFVQLADILFVIAFLVLIFGTTLNMDAYTVKKALPRLVIAAIAVQISYFLCGILIDIGNVFGDGLMALIQNAVSPGNTGVTLAQETVSNGQKFLGATSATVAGGGLIVTGLFLGPTVLFIILGFVLSVLTFIVTLLVRQLIINVLILLAPLAFVAWILPNTEGLFKKWRDNLVKIIMVYPIISLFLGATAVVQAASAGGTFINQLIGGIAPIIAFFMMPRVFKMSGQAMGLAGGAIGKIGGGANRKLQSSEVKKNTQAAYKAKAAERFMATPKTGNMGLNRVARGGFRLATGNVLPGKTSQRKISALEKNYTDSQGKEFKDQILQANNKAGLDFAELSSLAAGNDVNGIKSNSASQEVALNMLAEKQQWGAIRTIQQNKIEAKTTELEKKGMTRLDASTAATTQIQGQMSRSLQSTDVAVKARDLISPPASAFKNMDADRIANMHHSTLQAYADVVRNSGDPEMIADFENATNGALNSSTLRSKISKDSGKIIYDAANGGTTGAKLMTNPTAVNRVNGTPAVPATPTTPYQPPISGIDSQGRVL
jgi:hypothetical protein